MLICVFIVSVASILNILGAVLNVVTWLTLLVLELVLYLCGPLMSILMSFIFGFSTSGITWGCASGVSAFFLQFSFLITFLFFFVSVKFLLLVGQKNDQVFSEFTGWIYYGYSSTIISLRGSSLVTFFDRDALFILSLSWFISLSFSWTTSLTSTLGGTAGGLYF